jgi:hypothetical protein
MAGPGSIASSFEGVSYVPTRLMVVSFGRNTIRLKMYT